MLPNAIAASYPPDGRAESGRVNSAGDLWQPRQARGGGSRACETKALEWLETLPGLAGAVRSQTRRFYCERFTAKAKLARAPRCNATASSAGDTAVFPLECQRKAQLSAADWMSRASGSPNTRATPTMGYVLRRGTDLSRRRSAMRHCQDTGAARAVRPKANIECAPEEQSGGWIDDLRSRKQQVRDGQEIHWRNRTRYS
jgi:hypothetical protein